MPTTGEGPTDIFTLFYYACYDNLRGVEAANVLRFSDATIFSCLLFITHANLISSLYSVNWDTFSVKVLSIFIDELPN